MSKRHARRIAKNRNASKPRWRKEGRALQRAVAQLTATLDEATKALEVSNARIAELLAERGAVVQSVEHVICHAALGLPSEGTR